MNILTTNKPYVPEHIKGTPIKKGYLPMKINTGIINK